MPNGLEASDWITAGIIAGATIAVAIAINYAAQRAVSQLGSDRFADRFIGRLLAITAATIGLIYALSSLDIRIEPLLGALGIGGLALAFALQDIIENFAAGIILQVRQPASRGDQVWSNDFEGTVLEINLRSTVIRSFDGETVYIPNADVLKNPLVNYTKRRSRRTTLVVGVTYDSALDQTKDIIVAAAAEVEGVLQEPKPEAFVQEFGASSMDIAVRFWHKPGIADLWRVRDGVAISVKAALDKAGIGIPFPQRTVRFADGPVAQVTGVTKAD